MAIRIPHPVGDLGFTASVESLFEWEGMEIDFTLLLSGRVRQNPLEGR